MLHNAPQGNDGAYRRRKIYRGRASTDKMRMHSVYVMAEQFIGVVRVIFSDGSHTVPKRVEEQITPTPSKSFIILWLV